MVTYGSKDERKKLRNLPRLRLDKNGKSYVYVHDGDDYTKGEKVKVRLLKEIVERFSVHREDKEKGFKEAVAWGYIKEYMPEETDAYYTDVKNIGSTINLGTYESPLDYPNPHYAYTMYRYRIRIKYFAIT